MKLSIVDERSQSFKQQAKQRHKIVGLQTWHLNLNPSAMPTLAFSKGAVVPSQPKPKGHHVDWRGPFAKTGPLRPTIATAKMSSVAKSYSESRIE